MLFVSLLPSSRSSVYAIQGAPGFLSCVFVTAMVTFFDGRALAPGLDAPDREGFTRTYESSYRRVSG